MKRLLMLFSAVLTVLFAAPVTARAAQSTTLTVTADKAVANPGDKVNFTVNLGAVDNLGVMDFKLKIPAGLSMDYNSVALPEGLGALLDSDGEIMKPTQINENAFSYSAQKTGYTGSQELCILTFTCTVDSDSALEKKTVEIQEQEMYDNTTDLKAINVTVKPAELTVEKKTEQAQSTTLTVTADKAVANPGDKVNFTVNLGAVNNLGVMDFKLKIPAGLSIDYNSVALPEGLGALLDSDGEIMKPTQINENAFSYSAQKTGYTGSQELCILTFTCTVDSDSALEKKTVEIQEQEMYDNTTDLKAINVTVKPAELTVEKKIVPAGCEHSMTKVAAVAATCEADGNVEYYACSKCKKNFSDAQGTKEITDITQKATGHKAGAWTPAGDKHTQACTVCGKNLKEEAHKYDNEGDSVCDICGYQRFYQVIGGADASYDKESESDLIIRADGSCALFEAVKVDGEVVSPENYTVAEGSTVVTLKKAYLETLSEGEHKIEITYTDGKVAETKITIQEKPKEPEKSDPSEEQEDSSKESEESEGTSEPAGNNADKEPVKSPKTGGGRSAGLIMAVILAAGTAGAVLYRKNKKKS